MTDSKGENKRVVKKVKNGVKTANIKISTEDPDIVQKNNKESGKNSKAKNSNTKENKDKKEQKGKKDKKEEKKEARILEENDIDLI